MSSNDPWFWSVDEVVAQLCHSFALYVAAAQSATDIPDCPALEKELRMRNITGKALLAKFDAPTLVDGNELRISQTSQRLALVAVIAVLRRRSHAYKQLLASEESVESTRVPRKSTISLNGVAVAPPTIQSQRWAESSSRGPLRQTPQMKHMRRMPSEPDDFEYLLRWQDTAEDDEIIDFAADDSLEDDGHANSADDHSSDDVDAMLDSAKHDLPRLSKLSEKEIYDIIDERINFYMESWTLNAGVIPGEEVNYDVNAMWDEAEASGQRLNLAQKYEAEYAYFKRRLDAMREEIKKFPGSNANQIRQQCRNLEGTIESMELAGWLKEIYELEPVADSDDESVNGDGELASYSDNAVHNARPSTSQDVAGTNIIDLDSPPEAAERETTAPNTGKLAQDATYLFGIPVKYKTPTSTQKPCIAHSIEPMVGTRDESQNSRRILSNYGDEPENASVSSVRRWKWHELIEHLDRKRIVSKTISEMNASDLEAIRTRVRLIPKSGLLREIAACVNMLRKGESQLQAILPRDMQRIVNFTNLFLSWWFCRNYFEEPSASVRDLEELQSCLEDGSAGTRTFCDYLRTIMQTTFSEQALQHPERPSQAEIIEISDDD